MKKIYKFNRSQFGHKLGIFQIASKINQVASQMALLLIHFSFYVKYIHIYI